MIHPRLRVTPAGAAPAGSPLPGGAKMWGQDRLSSVQRYRYQTSTETHRMPDRGVWGWPSTAGELNTRETGEWEILTLILNII